MAKDQPKQKEVPSVGKTPKHTVDDKLYKGHLASWQIGYIDLGSSWGDHHDKLEFSFQLDDRLLGCLSDPQGSLF